MKKNFILLATTLSAAMAVGTISGKVVGSKGEGETWTCINGDRQITENGGVVTLTTDDLGVQHQKNDIVYLDGCSFRFTNKGSNNAMFFFTPTSQSTVSFSGPVFQINRTDYGQTRLYAYADHDFNTNTNFLYSSIDPEVAGVGGQASPQVVCDMGDGEDSYDFSFERVNSAWWKVTMTETVTGKMWDDTANYSGGSAFFFVKDSAMTLNEDGSGYMQIRGNSNGTTEFSNFVNGTAWEAPAGPDKPSANQTVDAYVSAKDKFSYTTEGWAAIQSALATAKASIESAETQEEVDNAVATLKSTVDGVSPREWVNSTEWACSNGANDVRLATESEGAVKFYTDAWGVRYTKSTKVTLDGFQMTFGSYHHGVAGNMVGFFFTDSATSASLYQGAVFSIFPNRWGDQDRVAITDSHDEAGTVKAYQDYNGEQVVGFGGQGGNQLVLEGADPLLMTFKFEHVTKSWWKLTISETEYGKISLPTTNYGTLSDETTKYSSVYIKSADLPLDEGGQAYLNVYGLAGNAIVKDIVNGTYRELPEEPATEGEIANIKSKVNAATSGYRDSFATKVGELKTAALEAIDAKTYLSEMEPIVDQLKLDVKAAYLEHLGYSAAPEAVAADANWFDCWGQGTKASRLDGGEVMLALPNSFGVRGQLLTRLDPLNFTAKINVSTLIDSTVLMMNFDSEDGAYCNQTQTKYYHIEFLMCPNGQVQVVVGNTDAHNVSVEGWSTSNVNTYTGKTIALANNGDLTIAVSTDAATNKTTITINEATAELDTSVLFKGQNCPEEPVLAAVQVGTMNNDGVVSLVRVDEFADAAYSAYKAGLEDVVGAYKSTYTSDIDAMTGAYATTTTNPDADYANYLTAKDAALSHINGLGLTSFDKVHFIATEVAAVEAVMSPIEEDYAGKVAAEKAKVTELLASYNENDYREAEKTALATAKGTVEEQLAGVTSCNGAKALAESAKAALDAIKTNAQWEAEEAVAAAKTAACAQVDAKLDLADDDHITDLARLIASAKQAINECTSIEAVNAELASQLESINSAVAQWNAEKAAQALRSAKDSAIAELGEMADQADEKHAESVAAVLSAATTEIEACTTVEQVSSKLTAKKAELQAALDAVLDEPVKPGCRGGIATSALITLLAFAGVVILKRKEN